jgi:hypothetical protein
MYRTRRIGLGAGDLRRRGKRGEASGKMKKAAARDVHDFSLAFPFLIWPRKLTCFPEA